MRRFTAGLVIGLVAALAIPTFAADHAPVQETELVAPATEQDTLPPIKLVVNGQEITLPDAQPRVVDGQVMVPVMAFSQVAGFGVEWDEAAKTVKVTTKAAEPPKKETEPPAESAYSLTVTENGVTYYEMEKLRELLKARYPGASIGLGRETVRVGTKYYSVVTTVVGDHGYVDVRPLLDAEVIKADDLAQHYAR